jgi:poly(3-hydroxybutyrate) depolymerase
MKPYRFALVLAFVPAAWGQLTPGDTLFAGLSARTQLLAYKNQGGDLSAITPLMGQQNYRSLTHAMSLMDGNKWTPDAELATALDFAIGAKLVGTGESLTARATFVFDAPDATQGPYKFKLALLNGKTTEATVEPGLTLGDVRGRKTGEMIGVTFDPSKLVQPGLHTIKATLEDGHGTALYEYFRTFFVVADLSKRAAALEKTLELLPDQRSPAALTARNTLETVQLSRQSYYVSGFQNLTGYVFTRMRAAGLGASEGTDFDPTLTRATMLATSLKEGQDPLANARGVIALAYRSAFDGKLVPYEIYVPANYSASKKYPLVVLLHGAGGDEKDFIELYQKQWPKFAEERGYLLASVNGRGPTSGYSKESGGEQDMLDVLDMMKSRYSVDASHVFLGGHSMGGAGTWRLGMQYADKFAGLIPIAGTSAALVPGLDAAIQKGVRTPVLIVCGVKDALVTVDGCRSVAKKADEIHAPVQYKEYADGDHLTVAVMSIPDIFKWLDEQLKAKPGGAAAR